MKRSFMIWFLPLSMLCMAGSCETCDPLGTKDSNTLTDVDGNTYKTVTIGTQVWMAENLKTTKFNDGTSIPLVTDNTAWTNLTTPSYCWYNNDAATNKNIYGALYKWYTVSTGNLCPTGWHVPSDSEWAILFIFLGGEKVAGDKLKEMGTSHWLISNAGATNETGFTAVPGGVRYADGTFSNIGQHGYWLSSTVYSYFLAWYRGMSYSSGYINTAPYSKLMGFSVRCLRD